MTASLLQSFTSGNDLDVFTSKQEPSSGTRNATAWLKANRIKLTVIALASAAAMSFSATASAQDMTENAPHLTRNPHQKVVAPAVQSEGSALIDRFVTLRAGQQAAPTKPVFSNSRNDVVQCETGIAGQSNLTQGGAVKAKPMKIRTPGMG